MALNESLCFLKRSFITETATQRKAVVRIVAQSNIELSYSTDTGWSGRCTHLAVIEEKTHGGDDAAQSTPTAREHRGRKESRRRDEKGRPPPLVSDRNTTEELPEIDSVDEEEAHHRTVQQEHKAHVEVRRVAHP